MKRNVQGEMSEAAGRRGSGGGAGEQTGGPGGIKGNIQDGGGKAAGSSERDRAEGERFGGTKANVRDDSGESRG